MNFEHSNSTDQNKKGESIPKTPILKEVLNLCIMTDANIIANIRRANVCLEIPNISKLNKIWSPEVFVQGVPWKMNVCKKANGRKEGLGVYLHSAKKDKPENWSHPAFATLKLLPFDNAKPIKIICEPYVFDNSDFGYGSHSLIEWQNLFDAEKKFVQNDTINLDISIEAADSDEQRRSKLSFEYIGISCRDGCMSSFRFSITNIKSLMAVRSPQYAKQKLPWDFTVLKNSSSSLYLRLKSKIQDKKAPYKVRVRAKVMSSKGEHKTIEVMQDKIFENSCDLVYFDVLSWEELFKPENGLVNNNSITMEVDIETNKPEGMANSDQNSGASVSGRQSKRRKMECSVCLATIANQEVSCTKCGHLFCTTCITDSIRVHNKCPACNTFLVLKDLRTLFLPL